MSRPVSPRSCGQRDLTQRPVMHGGSSRWRCRHFTRSEPPPTPLSCLLSLNAETLQPVHFNVKDRFMLAQIPGRGLLADLWGNELVVSIKRHIDEKTGVLEGVIDRCMKEVNERFELVEHRFTTQSEAMLAATKQYVADVCNKAPRISPRTGSAEASTSSGDIPKIFWQLQRLSEVTLDNQKAVCSFKDEIHAEKIEKQRLLEFMEQSVRRLEDVLKLLAELPKSFAILMDAPKSNHLTPSMSFGRDGNKLHIGGDVGSNSCTCIALRDLVEQRFKTTLDHIVEIQEGWAQALNDERKQRESAVSTSQDAIARLEGTIGAAERAIANYEIKTAKSSIQHRDLQQAPYIGSQVLSLVGQLDQCIKEVGQQMNQMDAEHNERHETSSTMQNVIFHLSDVIGKESARINVLSNELERLKMQGHRANQERQDFHLPSVVEHRLSQLMAAAEQRIHGVINDAVKNERSNQAILRRELMERMADLAEVVAGR